MKRQYERKRLQAFSHTTNRKKLYKKGKNWIVVSLMMLAMTGAGASVAHLAHADSTQQPKPTQSAAIGTEQKAKAMYNGLVANSATQTNNQSSNSNNGNNTSNDNKSNPRPVVNLTNQTPKSRSFGVQQQNVWADIQYVNMDGQSVASDAQPNEPIDPSTVGNYAKNIPGCSPFLGGTAESTTTVPTTSKTDRDVWQFSFMGSPTGKATWAHPDKLPADLRPVTPAPKPQPKPQPARDKYPDQTITVHFVNDTPGEPTYGQEFMKPLVAHYDQPINTSDNTAVWHPSDQIVEFIGYDKEGHLHYYTQSQISAEGAHYSPTAAEDQYPVGYHVVPTDRSAWESGSNVVSDIPQSDTADQNGSSNKAVHPFFFMPYNQNVYLHFDRAHSYINMYFNANDSNGPKLSSDIHLGNITNHPVDLTQYMKQNIDGFRYSPNYSGKSFGFDPYTLKNFDNAVVDPQTKVIDDIYSIYVPASDSVVYTYNGKPVATGMKATRPSDVSQPNADNAFKSYAGHFDAADYDNLPSQYSVSDSTASKFRSQFAADIQNHNYGYGYYNYVIPVHKKVADTVNYTYDGHVITQDGQTYSKSFEGGSGQTDTGLGLYYNIKSSGGWNDVPYGYEATDQSKASFFNQMADFFENHKGQYDGVTINIPLVKPQANMHIYYENANGGAMLSPEAQLSATTDSPFDVHSYNGNDYAPEKLTAGGIGYHRTAILHPADSFDANDNETHTIDVLYEPNAQMKPITVHYVNSDQQSLASDITLNNEPINSQALAKSFKDYKYTGQIGKLQYQTYPQDVYMTYKSTVKPKPKVIIKTVPGPTRVVNHNIPGPTKYITKNVPGPVQYVTKTVNVPGPTKYVTKNVPGPVRYITKRVNVPGPTKYVTKNIPGPVKYVNVPGPTKYITKRIPGQTKYVDVPGPTKYITKDVPGPVKYITKQVPGPVRYETKTVTVPGKTVTKTVQVPGPTKTVTKVVTKTVQVPGRTQVIHEPGKTVTKIVKVPSKPDIIHEPGKTIIKTVKVPGPVQIKRVPGPTITKVIYSPSPTKVIYHTITKTVPGPRTIERVPVSCKCKTINHTKIVYVPKVVRVFVTPKHLHRHNAAKHRAPKMVKKHSAIHVKPKHAIVKPKHIKRSSNYKLPKATKPVRVVGYEAVTGQCMPIIHGKVSAVSKKNPMYASGHKAAKLPQTGEKPKFILQLIGMILLLSGMLLSAGCDRRKSI